MADSIGTALTTRSDNEVRRQGFSEVETYTQRETAAMATASREKALIEARFAYAMHNRRSIDDFEQDLLKECRRPSFASKAKYSLPKGKKNGVQQYIEGPTIRMIETALRCFRNTVQETATVYESSDSRIIRITVSDLESNNVWTTEVIVQKTVERKGFYDKKKDVWEPPFGRIVISARPNSDQEMVFLCESTEDEMLAKQNALISKAVRTLALRLLPGDIVEEAMNVCQRTVDDKDAKDPDAAKKSVLDGFAELEIRPSDLERLLGHKTDRINPAEMKLLRKIYVAVKSGETTWEQVLAEGSAEGSQEGASNVAERKIAEEQAKQQPKESAKPTDTKGEPEKPVDTKRQREPGDDDAEEKKSPTPGGLFGGSRR